MFNTTTKKKATRRFLTTSLAVLMIALLTTTLSPFENVVLAHETGEPHFDFTPYGLLELLSSWVSGVASLVLDVAQMTSIGL